MSHDKYDRLPLKRILALIFMVGAFVFALLAYSLNTGLRIAERYTPLIDATMEIKLEATTGHLWFEEILSNSRDDNIEPIRTHIKQAQWYANAMLMGGSNSEGVFFPLQDLALRSHIKNVQERLGTFSELMELRWLAREVAGPGTSYDQEFDQVFGEFITETDNVETRLQELTIEAQSTFKVIQGVLALITLVATALVAYIFFSFARVQNRNLNDLSHEVEERKRVETILRQQATTDPLTGLYNRRHITDVLQEEFLRSKRRNNPYSVVIFDIDHFKAINDTHGHDFGDQVLQTIARVVSDVLREVDVLARWGGEEFLVLLRDTDLGGAMKVAEKYRTVLAAEQIEGGDPVTASFGVAQFKENESVRDLVHRADEALYEAKAAGRNRVHTNGNE